MNTPQVEALNPTEVGVVKMAAAQRYREQNINPKTAEFLFDRLVHKMAVAQGLVEAPAAPAQPSEKVMKLAAALRPLAAKATAARSA